MRPRAISFGSTLVSALVAGGCGLFFGDIDGSGSGGTGAGGSAATALPSGGGGAGANGGGDEGGGGGKGPGQCSEGLDSLGSNRWFRTIASAEILDVAVAGKNIVAVGKATPNLPCGIPFTEDGLVGERLFLLAVNQDTAKTERVVDLGPAEESDEVRLSHGETSQPLLVVWTRPNGLCMMPASSASSDCSDAKLKCTLASGSFFDIGVASTSSPMVLFRKDGEGECATDVPGSVSLSPTSEHILLELPNGDQKLVGAEAGTSMGIVAMDDSNVRISGICAQSDIVGGQACAAAADADYGMFAVESELGAADFGTYAFFSPATTVVSPQFGFIAPAADGVAYSAPGGIGDERRKFGWNDGTPVATGPTFLQTDGTGDLDFPTGIRSAEALPNGQGRILAGVTHAALRSIANGSEVFDCTLQACAPFAFWFHAPSGPFLNTAPRPFAVVANDKSGRSCQHSATAGVRGLLLEDSAVLGGVYRCGRPAVGETSLGLRADSGDVNAFLARLTPEAP